MYLYTSMLTYRWELIHTLGKIFVVLSDNVERRLRLAAVVRLGGKKGVLSGAIEEAVNDWLKKDMKPRD
jgi:hypothetical protein